MKLKEIVKISATYLGRDDVISYIDSTSGETPLGTVLELVDNITRCANLVINELSSTYIPMYKEESKDVEGGKLFYTNLSETAIEILEVKDEFGISLDFEVHPEYVSVNSDRVKIRYKYVPSNYGLTDEIGYSEAQIPARVIAYGTASEFCLTERGFSESLMWRNRFNDSLLSLMKPKNKTIKSRRFFL